MGMIIENNVCRFKTPQDEKKFIEAEQYMKYIIVHAKEDRHLVVMTEKATEMLGIDGCKFEFITTENGNAIVFTYNGEIVCSYSNGLLTGLCRN